MDELSGRDRESSDKKRVSRPGPIYMSGIAAVRYSIASDEDTRTLSRVGVLTRDMYEMNHPKPYGMFDANMGTIDSSYLCASCRQDKEHCHGHSGFFKINYPCLAPATIAEVKKWLRVICFECGRVIISDGDIRKLPVAPSARLDYLMKYLSNQTRECVHCKHPHGIIRRTDKTKYSYVVRVQEGETMREIVIYPHNIEKIFEKVTDSSVTLLGKSPSSHPRNLIWTCLHIPPPAIRPDSKKQGQNRGVGHDSVTTRIREFIAFAEHFKPNIPAQITEKFASEINMLNGMLTDFLIYGSEKQKSIAMRLKAKAGRFRSSLLAKRAHGMARSTIDGSNLLHLDQISVPLFVARTLQIEETVQDFNRERLALFVRNGTARYPGCTRITKRSGISYRPDARNLELENGDVVMRDLVNGDILAFNRQPTLTLSNITAFRIIVDARELAIGMSTLVCPFFNADFDGDQMNLFNFSRPASINEQMMMTNVGTRMISHTTGAMMIGQSGDSLIGLTKLTQFGTQINRYHANLIFGSTNVTPNIEELFAGGRDRIDGRDLISLVLAATPINYTRTSAYYDPSAPWMRWLRINSEHDRTVEIVGGRLVRGCLDKPSIGAGASSMYQIMAHEYGTARTLDVIYNMQQIGINYLSQHGFTAGWRDFTIAQSQHHKIVDTGRTMLTKALMFVDKLNGGKVVPPIGKSIAQFYEEQQMQNQRVVDDYHEPVLCSIENPRANGIFELMASGCKGSLTFLVNMVASVGLIVIGGERVRPNFGYARTLPYYPRFEELPEARGYVNRSFIEGLDSVGCIYNMMMARVDVISRALLTSVTGYQNHKSIRNLESIIANNYRMAVKHTNIVSFVYGGDFLDPRSLEVVSYGPALLSDAEFIKKYAPSEELLAGSRSADILREEFEQVRADRASFREIFKRLEDLSVRDKVSPNIKMPFNIARIVERMRLALSQASVGDQIRLSAKDTASEKAFAQVGSAKYDYADIAKMVARFCDDLPYLFINEIQKRRHGAIPQHIASAATLMRMYVRAELCANRVATMIAPGLDGREFIAALLNAIETIVSMSLIDPGTALGIIAAQSFSEPFTQDILDAYKLSALGHPTRPKMAKAHEILGAYRVDRLSNPSMTVILTPENASSQIAAQEIALQIEMLRFSDLVSDAKIFFEIPGQPTHPDYAKEGAIFRQFVEDNPLLQPPTGLSSWCLRFGINKSMLVQKNISMQTLATRLREKWSVYLVFTPESAPDTFIRIYVREADIQHFASRTDAGKRVSLRGVRGMHTTGIRMREIFKQILNTTVRGIDGIHQARAEMVMRTKISDTGAVVDDKNCWAVRTVGTNLPDVALVAGTRPDMLTTDAIQELAEFLGIEAARHRIIQEMRALVDKCNVRHYMIYADEMTRMGKVTSIERGGLSQREVNNVSLRAGQAAPVQVLTEAAINARRDVVAGVSGPLIYGTVPKYGTAYNTFAIDDEVVAKYSQRLSAESVLESL